MLSQPLAARAGASINTNSGTSTVAAIILTKPGPLSGCRRASFKIA
jgi:hypothetical protein